MPNLRKPTLSAQIGSFMDTPERAAKIKAWATFLNVTHGSIMRDVLDAGLDEVLQAYADELTGAEGFDEIYAAALEVEQRRADERAKAGASTKRAERALTHKRPRKAATKAA
jgi:hypothetical protein